MTLSPDFQTTPGAAFGSPATNPGSNYQVFVRKLSRDGSKTTYSTYLGLGALDSDHPVGMRVNAAGNVYLATNSSGVPTTGAQAIDPNGSIAVYKLAVAGDQLLYSARLFPGLSYTEPVALAIDSAGNAYVGAGSTTVYLSKIDPTGTRRLYGYQAQTGTSSGALADVAVGADGSAYLAGTQSGSGANGLTTTPGVLKPTVNNPQNHHGYLIRVKPDGSGPLFSTYIAGDYFDSVEALAVDSAGAAYVGGQTGSNSQFQGIPGTGLGLTQAQSAQAFVLKVTPDGTAATYTALLPNSSVNALTVDQTGQIYAAGPSNGGIAMSKIDAAGSKLLYYSALPVPTASQTLPATYGITIDSAGAAYVAASIASVQIPDTAQSSRLLSNAFLFKMDPNPDSCDLSLSAQADPSFVLGSPVHFVFTIHNNGPAVAQSVVLLLPRIVSDTLGSCQTSESGACGTDPSNPRAAFPSIPPGGNAQVSFTINPNIGTTSLAPAATVSTLTSDVNLDNNGAASTSQASCVTLTVYSGFRASYTVNGITGPVSSGAVPLYFAPGSQVQIFWPSPQVTPTGVSVKFQSWSDGSTENPRTFIATPPSLAVTGIFSFLGNAPNLAASGAVNAGSYAPGGIAPGELITLFGVNLGLASVGKVQDGQVTTSLSGATVTFDGIPAPMLAINATQINTIVPYAVAGHTSTTITVQNASGTYSMSVPVASAAPALFSSNGSGAGQAAALNQDGSVNSPANPAKPGDVIVLYGTGEGLVNPAPADGTILGWPAPAPNLPVTVTIGGQPAEVLYAGGSPGQVAGVIQINARIPASGIAYSHHVPVTWSAGGVPSQAGITIAVSDSPAPVPVFTVQRQDVSLPGITLSPSRIAADSNATQVTVSGTTFSNGMVVQWNGQARPTQFLDSTRLRVTLPAADLETPGLANVAVWNAAQTSQVTQAAPLLVYIPIANRDLIYDSLRNVIYVAVAAAQKPQGASIAVLDPTTGRVTRWYPLEAEPNKLAISGDGRYLYAGIGNLVRRIDLNSWTADLYIPLGQDSVYGTRTAYSIVVLPGSNTSLAVSFYRPGATPAYLGTAIFDGAQMRPTVIPAQTGPLYLPGASDANTMYGADAAGNLYTLRIDGNGVKIAATYSGLLSGDGDSVFGGGLICSGWGTVVDPTIPQVTRTYDNQGLIAPSTSSSTVLILGSVPPPGYSVVSLGPVLTAHTGTSGQRIWSLPLPVTLTGNHGPMLQWGTDGVVLREPQSADATARGIDLFRIQSSQ